MTELVRYESMDDLERLGRAMVASRYFEDAASISQAIVKILAGREMGFGPIAAMNGIHVIKGKPAIGANLMAAKVKAHPRYDYRVKTLTDTECMIAFYQDGQAIGESGFTAKDAQKAGTQNMGKFPRNMLFARAMSNGVKWFCPDVFLSGPVYTPEELGAMVDDDGYVDMPPVTVEKSRATEPPAYLDYDGEEIIDAGQLEQDIAHAVTVAEQAPPEPPADYIDAVEFGVFKSQKGKLHIGFMAEGETWPSVRWWSGRDAFIEAAPWVGNGEDPATKEALEQEGRRWTCPMRVHFNVNEQGYKTATRFEQQA